MKIRTYNDIDIEVIRQTELPAEVVSQGLQTCMVKDTKQKSATKEQIKYIVEAGHMSPLEHISQTIMVKGISRSLLMQITRHRTFKFTSSSQHYQDYSDYEAVVSQSMIDSDEPINIFYKISLNTALQNYKQLINDGIKKEEARQVLPGSMAVNLLITADARNMVNFFVQRRCNRNVEEMIIFADKWWSLATSWFPELFSLVGAPCFMNNDECNQGFLMSELCK
jgi:thymidylate synthase (FAD)